MISSTFLSQQLSTLAVILAQKIKRKLLTNPEAEKNFHFNFRVEILLFLENFQKGQTILSG